MTNPKFDPETILNAARRALASAASAQQILDAGAALPDLIVEIESLMDVLDDGIEAEAESVDRSQANKLRAEKDKASDTLTDVEYLLRRIDERHKTKLKDETDEALKAIRTSAMEKRAEALTLVVALEAPMRAIVDGVARYRHLMTEYINLRSQLEAAKRDDLRIPPLWRGVAQGGEDIEHIFDFISAGDRFSGANTTSFFKAVELVKATPANMLKSIAA